MQASIFIASKASKTCLQISLRCSLVIVWIGTIKSRSSGLVASERMSLKVTLRPVEISRTKERS